jgi:hypothetical protein
MKTKVLTNMAARARLCAVALTALAAAASWGQEYSSIPVTYAPGGVSGTPLTNAVPANSTNAVMSDPIGLTTYDSCAIQWEFTSLSNAAPLGCTNYLTFGASSDGVVFTPTNTPFLTLVVVIPPTSTNGVLVTNLPGALLGSIGYLQLQTMGCQGTNTTTNHSVLIWRKPKHNG